MAQNRLIGIELRRWLGPDRLIPLADQRPPSWQSGSVLRSDSGFCSSPPADSWTLMWMGLVSHLLRRTLLNKITDFCWMYGYRSFLQFSDWVCLVPGILDRSGWGTEFGVCSSVFLLFAWVQITESFHSSLAWSTNDGKETYSFLMKVREYNSDQEADFPGSLLNVNILCMKYKHIMTIKGRSEGNIWKDWIRVRLLYSSHSSFLMQWKFFHSFKSYRQEETEVEYWCLRASF